jgi:two-component system alkaline phosphatase synthesis response regulator PhoP
LEKTKILVVDDEPDTVSALRFRLEKAGYEVLTAEDGAAALDILRAQKVDVILADFMMPEVNGLELARLVKANPNWFETRIIMFSCNTDPEFRKRALEIGALDYLPKVDGYTNIIERLAEVAAPTRAAKARPAAQATVPDQPRASSRSRRQAIPSSGPAGSNFTRWPAVWWMCCTWRGCTRRCPT